MYIWPIWRSWYFKYIFIFLLLDLKNCRYNGVQFQTAHEKSGRDGLFNQPKGTFVDCQYADVTAALKQRKKTLEEGTKVVEHPKEWTPSGVTRKPDKDVFLLVADADAPNDVIKTLRETKLQSESQRLKSLHDEPPVTLPNPKTNPPKRGGYGYAQIGLSPYPEHLPDPMTKESSCRGIGGEIIGGPFYTKTSHKWKETFSSIPDTYGYKSDFKPKPVAPKVEPRFGPWYTSHPPKKGNNGYPDIALSKYPEHFSGVTKPLPPGKKIEVAWKTPGIPLTKPCPSIALTRINIAARRR